MKVVSNLVFGEISLPGLQTAALLWCPAGSKERGSPRGSLLIKALITLDQGPALTTPSNPKHLPKVPSQRRAWGLNT